MPLTVADIDRWNAQAVREVFHAASARAEVTFEASRQLAALSIFANSGGKTAEAAAHHNAGIRRDLDAHGNEALAVARAADRAADGIVKVQSELAALRHAAAAAELTIDALINRVVPIPGLRSTEAQWARTLAKQTELQAELDAIMAEANAVDEELASAVNMADGDAPIPADSGPPVGPEGLTPTQLASDANEERLREERARLQAHLERLQAEYDQLSVRAARDYHNGILDGDAVGRLAALTDELSAARGRLGELDAVDEALSRAPETYLTQLQIPEDPNQQVLAAVAVGNPDTRRQCVGDGSRRRVHHPGRPARHGDRSPRPAVGGNPATQCCRQARIGCHHRLDGLPPAPEPTRHRQCGRSVADHDRWAGTRGRGRSVAVFAAGARQ